MNDFSAHWLTRREPMDASARSIKLTEALYHKCSEYTSLSIVDLATGTGANLRYLAPRLKGHQDWLLVDQDVHLLSELPRHMKKWANENGFILTEHAEHMIVSGESFDCRLRLQNLDLATKLDRLSLEGCHLVTASALLDLVSEPWLHDLITLCQSTRVIVLFTLSYDGHFLWSPREPHDELVRALVNRHQHNDKGFGPALGPTAIQATVKYLKDGGYAVNSEKSEWHLRPRDKTLQYLLLQGWTEATIELQLENRSWIETWAQRRREYLHKNLSSLIVGHADLLGWPA